MKTHRCTAPRPDRVARLKSWAILVGSLLAIFVFLLVLGPIGLKTDTMKPMADFIEAHDINANGYYYSDVDEFFTAERHMRDHLSLVPGCENR